MRRWQEMHQGEDQAKYEQALGELYDFIVYILVNIRSMPANSVLHVIFNQPLGKAVPFSAVSVHDIFMESLIKKEAEICTKYTLSEEVFRDLDRTFSYQLGPFGVTIQKFLQSIHAACFAKYGPELLKDKTSAQIAHDLFSDADFNTRFKSWLLGDAFANADRGAEIRDIPEELQKLAVQTLAQLYLPPPIKKAGLLA